MKDICAEKIKDILNEDYLILLARLSKSLEDDSANERESSRNGKNITEQYGEIILHRMSMGLSTLIAMLSRVLQNQIDMTKKQMELEELVKQIPIIV